MISYTLEEGAGPILCPYAKCQQKLPSELILDYFKESSDVVERYLDTEFQRYALNELIKCPGEECHFFFAWDPASNCSLFGCPLCDGNFCISCRQPCGAEEIHTCPGEDEVDAKQCANCKRWIVRGPGCPLITCVCGFQFCYKCLSPKTRGCACVSSMHGYLAVGLVRKNQNPWKHVTSAGCTCRGPICRCGL